MPAALLALFANAAFRRALPYVLAAATILGGVWWIDHRAYQRGYDTASAEVAAAAAAETKRQTEANKRAWERAMREIDELTKQKEEADALVSKLREEGLSDPDARRPALSPGSVRRIDSVQ